MGRLFCALTTMQTVNEEVSDVSKHSDPRGSGTTRREGHSPRTQQPHSAPVEDEDPGSNLGDDPDDDAYGEPRGEERSQGFSPGRKLSKDDLQDLAKMSSDLVRRTLLSGIDIVRDVGKELPKEATQFLAARREQVLQNVSKDVIQHLINASIDRLFKTVREHRVEVSFRIVRDAPKTDEALASVARERKVRNKTSTSDE